MMGGDTGPPVLVGVREAASALGVHENTLRRWEQKGLIRAVKLPTGVRRFLREDIERLRKDMYDGLARESLASPGASPEPGND
jgi:excisionase family DNA binding protein